MQILVSLASKMQRYRDMIQIIVILQFLKLHVDLKDIVLGACYVQS